MLRNLIWRFAWLLPVLVFSGLLALLVYRNLNVRFIADSRFELDPEALAAFERNIPESPRLNLRIAESWLADVASDETALETAHLYAVRAANRSLWDYRTYLVLGSILELKGDLNGSEQALRRSIRLSPNYTRANWALGNLLLRQNRVAESIPYLRAAARVSEDLYLPAFDLLWQVTGGSLGELREMTTARPGAELLLVSYLLERSLPEPALAVFRAVDRTERIRLPETAAIINRLIEAGQLPLARQLWVDLFGSFGAPSTADGEVWNGDFELETSLERVETPALSAIFDWNFSPTPFARIGIDEVSSGEGRRSLRVVFTGRDTTTIRQEIRQLIRLSPGRDYRLEFSYQTRDLQSPRGPGLAIMADSQPVVLSAPIPNGTTTEWTRSVTSFRAPAEARPFQVAIIRIPQFSYDEPTRGAVWFDDIVIREASPDSGLHYDQPK